MINLARGTHAFVLPCLLAIACDAAAARAGSAAPLLNRGMFLTEPEITAAQISPDGELLAFLRPLHGVETLWVKRTDEPLAAAVPVTAGSEHSPMVIYWSNDSRYLLFTSDLSANGKADVFAAEVDSLAGSSDPLKARNLTDGWGRRPRSWHCPRRLPARCMWR